MYAQKPKICMTTHLTGVQLADAIIQLQLTPFIHPSEVRKQ